MEPWRYDIDGNKHGAWIGWDENGLMSYETVWEFGIYPIPGVA